MKLSHKNIIFCWKTTILGVLFVISAILYLILKESHEFTIVFGLIGIGIALIFSPDVLIDALKSFITKNKDKEL